MDKFLLSIIGLLCLLSVGFGAIANTSRTTTANVTTVSAVVLPANYSRKYVFIENYSDSNMWINMGQAAVSSASIPVEAADIFVFDASYLPYQGSITAICVSDNKTITFIEAF